MKNRMARSKQVLVKLDAGTHAEFRVKCFMAGRSMQSVFEELAVKVAADEVVLEPKSVNGEGEVEYPEDPEYA